MSPDFDLYRFDGATVLVKSGLDAHDPPVALRGTVDIRPTSDADATPAVSLILDFPDLFSRPAHRRVIHLDAKGIDRLLASAHDGVFEFTLAEELDPAA